MTAAASDSLAGKVAIVTGGGSGSGRGCAVRLAADGAKVGVFDLDPGNAKAVVDEIVAAGGVAHPVTCDVTSREQIDAGVAEIRALYGPATILVTSAGREGFRRLRRRRSRRTGRRTQGHGGEPTRTAHRTSPRCPRVWPGVPGNARASGFAPSAPRPGAVTGGRSRG
ncbi:SDR family NAD(P)-dependent oxidoreductase [Pseudofrankia sp. DC12]|uniref:SDR family NAD(P)-dependent oxidoreductase n=1 Tax=Pseudofrankia sp. DC12 TaxID=683315 RepID=UPI000AD7CA00|nr:SDR family NAD(P)-dependent oxidoreductase [Pseudofrankia sp. DC12]